MTRRVWVVKTETGDRQEVLPMEHFSWERCLNAGGGGSATIITNDARIFNEATGERLIDVWKYAEPNVFTFVLEEALDAFGAEWGVLYAGVVGNSDFDDDTSTLTIQHDDIWSILKCRLAIDKFAANAEVTKQVYTNISSGTLIKRILTLGMTGPADMNMALRISRPADEAGTLDRTYYGYQLDWVGDLINDLINEDGGADVDFMPRWFDGKLDYQMRVGTVAQPKLVEGLVEWTLGAEKSGITKLRLERNGDKQATASYAVGEGSGVDQKLRSNRVLNSTTPTRDRVASYPHEESLTTLGKRATGDLNAFKDPTNVWSLELVNNGEGVKATDLRMGMQGIIHVSRHSYIPTDRYKLRLVRLSGDLVDSKLVFQPEREA